MRRALPSLLLALAAVTGCGGGGGVHALHAWDSQTPYLPPPSLERPAATKPRSVVAHASPAAAPAQVPDNGPASGAPTDAQIARELQQAYGAPKGAGLNRLIDSATLTSGGLATIPPSAPPRVADIINAANQVARKPYVYGGGHGRGGGEGIWIDSAYDCSGSVSFALANAGFIRSPEDSSSLEHFGRPGPGRWVTIYANAGHAFMTVAGLRFDTVGLQQSGSRWQPAYRSVSGFVVRHPPGL
ncbi:MAG TPA: hypothetical protein VFT42_09860 [Solirubrobacteraceae bacterium]|nr:hypothetical protein [Solirubrobacteraceae bacterium]